MSVRVDTEGAVTVVTIDRPQVRNAVDGPTAAALAEAFRAFEGDGDQRVAVLTGAGDSFCAGADLGAVSAGGLRLELEGDAPLGPSRMLLSKPVIAAVEGHAVAGGLGSRCGATSASSPRTPSSGCSAGAGACRWRTAGRCGWRASWDRGTLST